MTYCICFDTICGGYTPIKEEVRDKRYSRGYRDQVCTYPDEAAAQAEIDSDPEFYEDCFPCPLEDIGHKTIFYGSANHA